MTLLSHPPPDSFYQSCYQSWADGRVNFTLLTSVDYCLKRSPLPIYLLYQVCPLYWHERKSMRKERGGIIKR